MSGDGREPGDASPNSRLSVCSPSSPDPSQLASRHLVRRIAWPICIIVAMGLVARVACLRGWPAPAYIQGPSMADAYVGEHWQIGCPHCQFIYRCAVEHTPVDDPLICPNCGLTHSLASNAELRPADRVWIDRWPTLVAPHALPRGAVVAITDPNSPDEFAIKRLVGFPGESISIRQGDLWVNDNPWRKTWNEFTSQWIVVHDDRFRATRDAPMPNRWRPDSANQGWTIQATGYRFTPVRHAENESRESMNAAEPTLADEAFAWLRFHPVAGFARPSSAAASVPIRDLDVHTPDTSRPLHLVTDLALRLRLNLGTRARLVIQLRNGRESLRVEYDGNEHWQAGRWENDRWLEPVRFSLPHSREDHAWELAVAQCDHRLFVVVDGNVYVQQSLPLESAIVKAETHPWSIGAADGDVEVRDLRVFRDIHYLASSQVPEGDDRFPTWTLHDDQWFVLGDNPAVSIDSRTWTKPGVRRRNLYGFVQRLTKRSESD